MKDCEGLIRPFDSSTEAECYVRGFVEEILKQGKLNQGDEKYQIGLPVIWWATAGAATVNMALQSLSESAESSLKNELALVANYMVLAQKEYVTLCGDGLDPKMALVSGPQMPMDHSWWRMELYLQLNDFPRVLG